MHQEYLQLGFTWLSARAYGHYYYYY